jgi:hypothetical protein
MMSKLKRLILTTLASAIVALPMLTLSVNEAAAGASDRSHIIVSMDRSGSFKNMHGGSVYSSVPDITSYYTSSNKNFIAKTMWVDKDGGNGYWIENGYFEGAGYGCDCYWDGFYYGYADGNGYHERRFTGPDKSIGYAHTHVIKYLGDDIKYWRAAVDGNYTWDIYGYAGDGGQDVGFETNNGSSKINSKTNVSYLRWYEDGSWHDWNTSADIIVSDYYNTGIQVAWNNSSETSAKWWE